MSNKRNRKGRERKEGYGVVEQSEETISTPQLSLQNCCSRLKMHPEYMIRSQTPFVITVLLDSVEFATCEGTTLNIARDRAAKKTLEMLGVESTSTITPEQSSSPNSILPTQFSPIDKTNPLPRLQDISPSPHRSSPALSNHSTPSSTSSTTKHHSSNPKCRRTSKKVVESDSLNKGNDQRLAMAKTPTSILYEYCMKHKLGSLTSKERSGIGNKIYVISVFLDENECGVGSGVTKAIAKHNASAQALQLLNPSFAACGLAPSTNSMLAGVSDEDFGRTSPRTSPRHENDLRGMKGGVNTTLGDAQYSALLYSMWQIDPRMKNAPVYEFDERHGKQSRTSFTCHASLVLLLDDPSSSTSSTSSLSKTRELDGPTNGIRSSNEEELYDKHGAMLHNDANELGVNGNQDDDDDDLHAAASASDQNEYNSNPHSDSFSEFDSINEDLNVEEIDEEEKEGIDELTEVENIYHEEKERCERDSKVNEQERFDEHGGLVEERNSEFNEVLDGLRLSDEPSSSSSSSIKKQHDRSIQEIHEEAELSWSLKTTQLEDNESKRAVTLKSIGIGSTKKDAKHVASKHLLFKLFPTTSSPEDALVEAIKVKQNFSLQKRFKRHALWEPQLNSSKKTTLQADSVETKPTTGLSVPNQQKRRRGDPERGDRTHHALEEEEEEDEEEVNVAIKTQEIEKPKRELLLSPSTVDLTGPTSSSSDQVTPNRESKKNRASMPSEPQVHKNSSAN